MEKPLAWREILANVIRDEQQRRQIAEQLNIHPVTLTRWATGKSNPRSTKLRALLNTLPAHTREAAKISLAQDYSPLAVQTDIPVAPVHEIHPEFYRRVMNTYTTIPSGLREWSLTVLITQQILAHLDPHQNGMHVFLAYCSPPSSNLSIRSLRKIVGRGTAPWNYTDEYATQFFGAESLVGRAIMRGHPITVQSAEDLDWGSAPELGSFARSICVLPLLRANQVAGSLCVMSTQERFFSHFHLDLLQQYTNLLVITCEEKSFFRHEDIVLSVMPLLEQQIPLLQSFQQRVMRRIHQATRQYHFLTKQEAELLVWQEIEEELLDLVSTKTTSPERRTS